MFLNFFNSKSRLGPFHITPYFTGAELTSSGVSKYGKSTAYESNKVWQNNEGGPSVEVFSAQGRDAISKKCRVTGNSSTIQKQYDKDVKSYVYLLEGEPTTTKIQLPKDDKQTLCLLQKFLVLQVFIPLGHPFSFELTVTDLAQNKRRIFLSLNQKDITVTPLHAKFPLTVLCLGSWLNLCVDLESLVAETFNGQTFKALENITVTANCRLRKIFTLKIPPADNSGCDGEIISYPKTEPLPRNLQLSTNSDHRPITQVLTYTRLAQKRQDSIPHPTSHNSLTSNEVTTPRSDGETHIAFGSKVVIPSHIRKASLKAENQENTAGKTARSARLASSRTKLGNSAPDLCNAHDDTAKTKTKQEGSLTENRDNPVIPVVMQPRPPKTSSAGKTRRPVRLKPSSGGKGRSEPVKQVGTPQKNPEDSQKNSVGDLSLSSSNKSDNDEIINVLEILKTSNKYIDVSQEGSKQTEFKNIYEILGKEPKGGVNGESCYLSNDIQDRSIENGSQNNGKDLGASVGKSGQFEQLETVQKDLENLSFSKNGISSPREFSFDKIHNHEIEKVSHSLQTITKSFDENDNSVNSFDYYNTRRTTGDLTNRSTEAVTSSKNEANQEEPLEKVDKINDDVNKNMNTHRSGHDIDVNNNEIEQDDTGDDAVASRDGETSINSDKTYNNNNNEQTIDVSEKGPKKERPRKFPLVSDAPVFTFSSAPRSPARSGKRRLPSSPGMVSYGGANEDLPEVVVSLTENDVQRNRGASLEDDFCKSSDDETHGHDDDIQKLLKSSLSPRNSPQPEHHQLRQSIRSSMLKEIPAPVKENSYDAHNYQSDTHVNALNQSNASSWRFDLSDSSNSLNNTHNDLEDSLNVSQGKLITVMTNGMLSDGGEDDEYHSDGSDDTSFGTWRAPPQELRGNKYQSEMKPPGNEPDLTATISISPRDYGGMFSPIIELGNSNHNKDGCQQTPTRPSRSSNILSPGMRQQDEEGELDLLYDPILNCYFDPKTHKYYELA